MAVRVDTKKEGTPTHDRLPNLHCVTGRCPAHPPTRGTFAPAGRFPRSPTATSRTSSRPTTAPGCARHHRRRPRRGSRARSWPRMRSTDQGRTWSEPVAVEPPDGPEASYAVLLKVPGGRIYVFYNHNTDNVREIPLDRGPRLPPGVCRRVDSLGYFVFKYSDDGGRTWSAKRYPIPVREMEIDRRNPFRRQGPLFLERGQAVPPRRRGLRLAAQGGRHRRRLLHPQRRRAAEERQHAHRARPGEDHLGDAARGRLRPAHAARRRPDRRGAELRGAQRRLVLLRLPHDRRPPGLRLQPRRRATPGRRRSTSAMPTGG